MIFDKLFGKSESGSVYTYRNNESDDKLAEVCKFESDTEDCSLISQLREKQKQYDILKSIINNLEKNKQECIQCTYHFLESLGNEGIDFKPIYIGRARFPYYNWDRLYCSVTYVLKQMSDDMFNKFINELTTLKHKDDVISKRKSELENLENEIVAIKQQLGIK